MKTKNREWNLSLLKPVYKTLKNILKRILQNKWPGFFHKYIAWKKNGGKKRIENWLYKPNAICRSYLNSDLKNQIYKEILKDQKFEGLVLDDIKDYCNCGHMRKNYLLVK